MPARQHNYTQLVIGFCGHVVQAWPQVRPIGGTPEVICEECTEAKWKIGPNDGLSVWVAIDKSPDEDDGPVTTANATRKAVTPRKSPPKPRKKAEPVCSICRKKGHVYTTCPLLVGQTTIPMPGE